MRSSWPSESVDHIGSTGPARQLRIAVLLTVKSVGVWMVPQLEELRSRGHQIVVIVPRCADVLRAELDRCGFEAVDLPFGAEPGAFIAKPRALLQLRRLVRRLDPDVLYYHLYEAALAARLSCVGLRPLRVHGVAGPSYLEAPLVRRAESVLWRLDDVIVCGSDYASRHYGAFGCPPSRRPVVSYGIHTDRIAPLWLGPDSDGMSPRDHQLKARAAVGVPAEGFLAVMVAYVYPPKRLLYRNRGHKGHDVLLTAWQKFSERHPDAHLLLVGDGTSDAGRGYRRQLADRFGVHDDASITWLPIVPDARPCYTAADVSVSPSLVDGHGAPAEAGAMAVPSIASTGGGLPETVDEKSGWVVPKDDPAALTAALEAAYAEFRSGWLIERGRNARELTVRTLDTRMCARRVADIVETAVAARRHRTGKQQNLVTAR